MLMPAPTKHEEALEFANKVAELVSVVFPCDVVKAYKPDDSELWYYEFLVGSRLSPVEQPKHVNITTFAYVPDILWVARNIVDYVWPVLVLGMQMNSRTQEILDV